VNKLVLLAATLGIILAPPSASVAAEPVATWECPEHYQVHEGLNTGFPHKGTNRSFWVYPPANGTNPAPVWMPLTGTVESTNDNLTAPRSGANALMARQGFMVIGPVRQCADGDPAYAGPHCNGPGVDGWNWRPWSEGRAANASGEKWMHDAGPDASFFQAAIKCVGTKWKLDPDRFYIGGISSGGTMTNRVLLFDSDFWAGGMPISGEWYVTRDDGTGLTFEDPRMFVAANPAKIVQGRVGPYPLPARLGPMIVVTVWGGDKDLWDCGPSIGLCADYRPATQASSNFFADQPNVVHVACSSSHGHMWPQINTPAFNTWALKTMSSHPKPSSAKDFVLTPPPEGYRCRVGRFTDHYPERG
jgi:poly(3-hydroxybutyrate) depolymerase